MGWVCNIKIWKKKIETMEFNVNFLDFAAIFHLFSNHQDELSSISSTIISHRVTLLKPFLDTFCTTTTFHNGADVGLKRPVFFNSSLFPWIISWSINLLLLKFFWVNYLTEWKSYYWNLEMRIPGYVISLYLKSNTSHPGGWKKMKDCCEI